ncbi:protein IQ-DOMAIN 31-like isoform X2 [Olea europaea var. sylvestris]|uniref:protein IQ-DOMAIN 31-like isoform X2 n=1 Tax=Olea europaea var. sylvestris TaxID=158386 RepID=UPI000C1D23AF|nr:protein IQ-DOMAIN 31-like isoform X2 [Olea europaea var. sylvestris]
MGRATRWLKSLFWMKKDRDKKQNSKYSGHSTIGLCNKSTTIPPNITHSEVEWLRSLHRVTEKEQNKHEIEVAAATAAVADTAMAVAQAAVAVVRFTASQGKSSREIRAAIKIQTVFRGYLARKALRALRGLVRLQALVRGYFVRKRAAATFHCMRALIRAQTNVLARKTHQFNTQLNARKSVDKFVSTGNEHKMSIHSRRFSASYESPKIVGVDTGRTRSRSRRTNTWMPGSNDDLLGQSMSSPLPDRFPISRLMPDSRNIRGVTGIECQGFFTTQVRATPRFANSGGCDGSITPARSFCVESYFRNTVNYQNYVANTHSFEAKLRSQSAPKQRPDPSPKRGLSHKEIKESRNSLDGVRMRRSKEAPKMPSISTKF